MSPKKMVAPTATYSRAWQQGDYWQARQDCLALLRQATPPAAAAAAAQATLDKLRRDPAASLSGLFAVILNGLAWYWVL